MLYHMIILDYKLNIPEILSLKTLHVLLSILNLLKVSDLFANLLEFGLILICDSLKEDQRV